MSSEAVFAQWNSVQDSASDGINGDDVGGNVYEIYGIAYKETCDKIIFAVSSNLPPAGNPARGVTGGEVTLGDIILNFTGQGIEQANGNLHAIRFRPNNDAGVSQAGVYKNVTAKSVAKDNGILLDNLQEYVDFVNANGGTHSFGGDLPPNYFDPSQHIKNVIGSGERVGGVQFLRPDHELLQDAASLPGFSQGQYIYGCSIDKSMLPGGKGIAYLAMECSNDIIAIPIHLNPGIDIEKFTQGEDADTPEEAVGVRPGDTVTWIYRVTNTGNVAFRKQDVKVTDSELEKRGIALELDRRTDRNGDGLLSAGEIWTYTASAPAEDYQVVIDFEQDALGKPLERGTIIDDEYAEFGLTIKSFTNPIKGDPTSTVLENRAMIFDTENPTGDDRPDLGTPHANFGGPGTGEGGAAGEPGENRIGLGNILILPEPRGTSEDPNDSRFGGTYEFVWDSPVFLNSIGFIDIEPADTNQNGPTYLETYDEAGKLLYTYTVPPLGDNSVQTLTLNGEFASTMKVVFGGSGGITGLSFDRYHANTGSVVIEPCPRVGDTDDSHYTSPRPGIDIEKSTNGVDADTEAEAVGVALGDQVVWEYVVKNTGNVPFAYEDVVVRDDKEDGLKFIASSDERGDRILSPGETWIYRAEGVAQPLSVKIDFDEQGIEPGTIIDTEYQDMGLTVSALARNGTPHPHGTMIFDTANPTGDDIDLGAPNSSVGGPGIGQGGQLGTPGQNLNPLGQVLILSGDGDRNDPDDSASGGTFVFTWDSPVDFESIGLMDIEEPGNKIVTYDANGQELDTYEIPALGDNSVQTFTLNAQDISSMKVFFVRSGAITDLEYNRIYKNIGSVDVRGWEEEDVRDEDPSHYTDPNPGIDIEKSTNDVDADRPEEAVVLRPNETVTWKYEVTNTGNVPFQRRDIQVRDNDPTIVIDQTNISGDTNGNGFLDPRETWIYTASSIAQALDVTVDFETDANDQSLAPGTVLASQYEAFGLKVSAQTRDRKPHPHGAMIFDTANPTGDDIDLGAPHSSVGGKGIGEGGEPGKPGQNLAPLGNVLILSGDGDTRDPDDSASGGIFLFEWENPVRVNSIGIMDIEEPGSKVITYDAAGNPLGTYDLKALGDNSVTTQQLGNELVSRMEVVFLRSGAITGLNFSQVYANVGTVEVTGSYSVDDTDASHYTTHTDPTFVLLPPEEPTTPPIITPSPVIPGGSVKATKGDDILFGTSSHDGIRAFAGDDVIFGMAGSDRLAGNIGNDHLMGGAGTDTLLGGAGNDKLLGAKGHDIVRGMMGNDHLNGGAGSDRIFGGTGQDRLHGRQGNDILRGGADRDLLRGGNGHDRFFGASGNDVIVTGAGRDCIAIRPGHGFDRVRDFADGADKIALGGLQFKDLSIQQRQDNVLISSGGERLLLLQNTGVGQITQVDFV